METRGRERERVEYTMSIVCSNAIQVSVLGAHLSLSARGKFVCLPGRHIRAASRVAIIC